MATDLLLIREGDKLAAHDPIALESIQALKQGETVSATIRRTRNPKHHRMLFALLNVVYESQSRYATLEQLLNAVKIETGYYDLQTLPGKIPVQICMPKSISFAKMDQTAFSQFFDKALEFIITEVLPGIDKADLERRVMEIIGES